MELVINFEVGIRLLVSQHVVDDHQDTECH